MDLHPTIIHSVTLAVTELEFKLARLLRRAPVPLTGFTCDPVTGVQRFTFARADVAVKVVRSTEVTQTASAKIVVDYGSQGPLSIEIIPTQQVTR